MFIVLGVCLKFAILPVVVDSMLMSQLKLEPSNEETWEAFITPPVTPYMKFTFFEVQVGSSTKFNQVLCIFQLSRILKKSKVVGSQM